MGQVRTFITLRLFVEHIPPRSSNLMPDNSEFTPRMGRIRNQDVHDNPLATSRATVRTASAPSLRAKPLAPGTIRYFGRGKGAAAAARLWSHTYGRRVFIKFHIARSGPQRHAAFARYLSYIKRDGTDRDGSRSPMYSQSDEEIGVRDFNARARNDPHQFRIIASPEDSKEIKDLTGFTRKLMAQAGNDLGTRLDWVAVNHFDTEQPHIHIVLRGKDLCHDDLYIDGKYITEGLRYRAERIVANSLGPKRWRDITALQLRDVSRNAFTSIDRDFEEALSNGALKLTQPVTRSERILENVHAKRLKHLQMLGLAKQLSPDTWRLETGWAESLKSLRRHEYIERARGNTFATHRSDMEMRLPSDILRAGETITGRIVAILPSDELSSRMNLLIDGVEGRLRRVILPEGRIEDLPGIGGVLSVSATANPVADIDQSILGIARQNGGLFSTHLLRSQGRDLSPINEVEFRRRLEALKRAGLATPARADDWIISDDFELVETGPKLSIKVRSWLPVSQLAERRAFTWLDETDPRQFAGIKRGYGAHVRQALTARKVWLEQQGLARPRPGLLDHQELQEALSGMAASRNKTIVDDAGASVFQGVYSGHLDLARRRFAIMENTRQIMAIPYTSGRASWQGRHMEVRRSGKSLEWSLGRSRG
jgi:type IV secretory pathway VirD2 relaxase